MRFATKFGEYELNDVIYEGRKARVLYTGDMSAQSGMPLDGRGEMLFEYNERFMELVRGLKPASLLLIGGGAFTLPKALLEFNPGLILDVVEPDDELEKIGNRYFGYVPGGNTRSFATTGAAYLAKCRQTYDMILIDAFDKHKVPAELQTITVAKQLRRVVKPDGLLAMNLISASIGPRSAVLERQVRTLETVFGDVGIFPAEKGVSEWIRQNYLLCAGRGQPGKYLRFAAIAPKYNDEV